MLGELAVCAESAAAADRRATVSRGVFIKVIKTYIPLPAIL
jgi:hypothetical protein